MARWLVGILLLLNLGVFLWGYQRQVPFEPDLPPPPDNVPRLEMIPEAQVSGGSPAISGTLGRTKDVEPAAASSVAVTAAEKAQPPARRSDKPAGDREEPSKRRTPKAKRNDTHSAE